MKKKWETKDERERRRTKRREKRPRAERRESETREERSERSEEKRETRAGWGVRRDRPRQLQLGPVQLCSISAHLLRKVLASIVGCIEGSLPHLDQFCRTSSALDI